MNRAPFVIGGLVAGGLLLAVTAGGRRRPHELGGTDGFAGDEPTPRWQQAIDAAEAQIGKPYQWGAAGPDRFDCSGLLWFVYQKAGLDFPRTSAKGLLEIATPVPLNRLMPGDLVFYGTEDNIHHVGLYTGDGRMIHAPHGGTTVASATVSALPDLYAGGRLLPSRA